LRNTAKVMAQAKAAAPLIVGSPEATEVSGDGLTSGLNNILSTMENGTTGGISTATLLGMVAHFKAEVKAEVLKASQEANNTRYSRLEARLVSNTEARLQEAAQFLLNSDNHSQEELLDVIDETCARLAACAARPGRATQKRSRCD
jgi:uncharacterized membrane-anchored protein